MAAHKHKLQELKTMQDAELLKVRSALQREIMQLRFSSVTQKVENPMAFREMRRTIARVNTLLTERSEDTRGKK